MTVIGDTVKNADEDMGGSIVDIDTQWTQDRYDEAKALGTLSAELTAWKNDKALSQIALVSVDSALQNVTVTASDFVNGENVIDASNVTATFLRSTKAYNGSYLGYGDPNRKLPADNGSNRSESVDILWTTEPSDIGYNALQSVWVEIAVPENAAAGTYTGTLTVTAEGKRAKLNSAYGRNGCGEEGMDWTMTYVERIIGYRPDGYILVDMKLVPKMVDLMGGVDVHLDHHIRVHTDGVEVYVPAGDAHLNGEEVLATLRYRAGYANADLGRVQVQRMVITECMKQWVSPDKLALLPEALELIQNESLTDLTVNNFLWIGKTILTGMDNMTSDTLPGYADMRGGASYFVLYPEQVAELVSNSYNPYTAVIDADDLDIAE